MCLQCYIVPLSPPVRFVDSLYSLWLHCILSEGSYFSTSAVVWGCHEYSNTTVSTQLWDGIRCAKPRTIYLFLQKALLQTADCSYSFHGNASREISFSQGPRWCDSNYCSKTEKNPFTTPTRLPFNEHNVKQWEKMEEWGQTLAGSQIYHYCEKENHLCPSKEKWRICFKGPVCMIL